MCGPAEGRSEGVGVKDQGTATPPRDHQLLPMGHPRLSDFKNIRKNTTSFSLLFHTFIVQCVVYIEVRLPIDQATINPHMHIDTPAFSKALLSYQVRCTPL